MKQKDMTNRAERLRALGDPTRLGIVTMLAERPRPATELHREFGIAGPAVSRHLRVLREAGLIREERIESDARVRLYSLDAEALDELGAFLGELTSVWQRQLDAFKDYASVRAGTKGRKEVAGRER
jgi:DNA-binding transcriptional ArsR family regulator